MSSSFYMQENQSGGGEKTESQDHRLRTLLHQDRNSNLPALNIMLIFSPLSKLANSSYQFCLLTNAYRDLKITELFLVFLQFFFFKISNKYQQWITYGLCVSFKTATLLICSLLFKVPSSVNKLASSLHQSPNPSYL